MAPLSFREKQILEFICDELESKGYPPAVREICLGVNLKSSSTVHGYLSSLEAKGYIKRDPTKPRAIEVLLNADDLPPATREVASIPLLGRVTAGNPILAVENIDEYIPLPRSMAEEDEAFLLRVVGESMIEAGILDGDLVIVRKQSSANNGDIVVAMIDEEATVKRFYREDGHIRLEPANPAFSPIISSEATVLGKVTGLIRRIH